MIKQPYGQQYDQLKIQKQSDDTIQNDRQPKL